CSPTVCSTFSPHNLLTIECPSPREVAGSRVCPYRVRRRLGQASPSPMRCRVRLPGLSPNRSSARFSRGSGDPRLRLHLRPRLVVFLRRVASAAFLLSQSFHVHLAPWAAFLVRMSWVYPKRHQRAGALEDLPTRDASQQHLPKDLGPS